MSKQTCKSCGREMPTALSCSQTMITFPDGEKLDRMVYMRAREQCADCGVHAGGFHHIGDKGWICDCERRPNSAALGG